MSQSVPPPQAAAVHRLTSYSRRSRRAGPLSMGWQRFRVRRLCTRPRPLGSRRQGPSPASRRWARPSGEDAGEPNRRPRWTRRWAPGLTGSASRSSWDVRWRSSTRAPRRSSRAGVSRVWRSRAPQRLPGVPGVPPTWITWSTALSGTEHPCRAGAGLVQCRGLASPSSPAPLAAARGGAPRQPDTWPRCPASPADRLITRCWARQRQSAVVVLPVRGAGEGAVRAWRVARPRLLGAGWAELPHGNCLLAGARE